ncbi:hypothetical protein [Arthrobacter sp. B3I4]|uniref:hypothetical protein n=1 Tax=Arthrobacter sp. B3I4 TaxID=3042267 RepID=UPI002788E28F|nr:hypothetical protein [Arthrobacter sp. B3I4]MDQ0755778.1 hypothetical protein [Arthrobacter sp. B3I4]
MNKLRPLTAALVLAVFSLTGCTGASPVAGTSPTTSSATASATPSPTPTATIAQFASILTEEEKTWRDYNDNITKCAFASIGKAPIDKVQSTTCKYTVQTVTVTAKTAARKFRALPTPPAEISNLRTRTLSALDSLAAVEATTACKDTQSSACDDAETLANGAIRPLISVLDAWRPYTK